VKKTSTFYLRYDIKGEDGLIGNRDSEWQLYLVDEKKVHVSELKKPSKFDDVKRIAPYKLFPGLPKTTEKDTIDLQAYYKNKFDRQLNESMLKRILRDEKKWDESPWFWKLISKRPDSQWIKERIVKTNEVNVKIKEAKYRVTVEECKPQDNNLYLRSFYEKAAGLPEFIWWTVYNELSDHEKQILRDLQETAAKTGLKIHAPDAPERKKFFSFLQPDEDMDDSEHNRRKKLIAGIFPGLPRITKMKREVYKTYKMIIEK
jgi:hypothetical protein